MEIVINSSRALADSDGRPSWQSKLLLYYDSSKASSGNALRLSKHERHN